MTISQARKIVEAYFLDHIKDFTPDEKKAFFICLLSIGLLSEPIQNASIAIPHGPFAKPDRL